MSLGPGSIQHLSWMVFQPLGHRGAAAFNDYKKPKRKMEPITHYRTSPQGNWIEISRGGSVPPWFEALRFENGDIFSRERMELGINPMQPRKAERDELEKREIAPHLKAKEVACRCGCGQGLMTLEALQAWARLRSEVGEPIQVISAYRCERHNARVGGSPTSRHVRGEAFDVWWMGRFELGPEGILSLAARCGFGGVGIGSGRLHLDTRSKPAVWNYKTRGDGSLVWEANEPATLELAQKPGLAGNRLPGDGETGV